MSTSNGIGYWRVKDAGELEATNIVIVGAHGECLGNHGERAHGMTLYESVFCAVDCCQPRSSQSRASY